MNVRSVLAEPDPVPFTVHSSLRRGDFLDRLQRAIGDYYKTEDGLPRYLSLGGSLTSGSVTLTVRPYLAPGEGQARGMMSIQLQGEVVSADEGSEFRGIATAPFGRAAPTFLAVGLAVFALIGISNGLVIGAFTLTVCGFMAVAWTWIIRNNQRSALGRMGEVKRIVLESIASG